MKLKQILRMKPKRTNLSKYLVALLSYGGVPDEYFLAQTHIIKSVSMDDFLLANMWNSLGQPFLRERLSMFMREVHQIFQWGLSLMHLLFLFFFALCLKYQCNSLVHFK
ncbi:hypothetical protein MKW98_016129 [Papaver atlanticum]|uniref:Uncharacterized protein n=1 Tax=Papaver atlanticum TaxID=357466 RepID=A0AAD4T332_9MAGN|nr:hypothetical protein MKW98_016129 [Papaver atlanticum]